jgi:hypothetical protein
VLALDLLGVRCVVFAQFDGLVLLSLAFPAFAPMVPRQLLVRGRIAVVVVFRPLFLGL